MTVRVIATKLDATTAVLHRYESLIEQHHNEIPECGMIILILCLILIFREDD